MSAPSSTQWGAIKGSGIKQGRIGINTTITNTSDKTTVKIDIWYWTKYGVSDSSNTFKYGWGTTSTTTIGSKSIKTTGNSGNGFSTANQVLIGSYTTTFSRGINAVTKYATASFANVEYGGGSGSVTVSFIVAEKESYTISFNANGGSGAPSNLSRQYNVDVNIPTTTPVRSGYKFLGWSTLSTATSPSYYHGATYPAFNANTTLYAVWSAYSYTVSYNANGGSGAPTSQNKSHGTSIHISSVTPTRTNYRFEGWGVTPDSTTVAYRANDIYSANASITLYAIWTLVFNKPRIDNFTVQRSDSNGNYQTDGLYCKVKFDWSCDAYVQSVNIYSKLSGSSSFQLERSVYANGYSGSVNEVIGSSLSSNSTYDIKIEVTDERGATSYTKPLSSKKRVMECRANRNGVTFGGTADEDGLVSKWDLKLKTGKIITPNGLEVDGQKIPKVQHLNGYWGIGSPDGTYGSYMRTPQGGILPYQSGGHGTVGTSSWQFNEGHFKKIYRGGTELGAPKVLWSGGYYMASSQTIYLSEPISAQIHGISLVFSIYITSTGASDYDWISFFLSKAQVKGKQGHCFSSICEDGNISKYLYIDDSYITGYSKNNGTYIFNGVTVNNDRYVLRYIIGM